ncbi:Exosome complex component MTR3, partial [Stegodyphus mimosarum]
MGKDNKRIAAPDNCMSPNAFKKLIKISNLVNEKGLRQDERTPDDLRSMSLSIGITTEVTGSAYLECGNTKIICSVNGPRDVLHKSDSSTKGQLYCEFKYASFSCTERQSYQPTD